MTAFIELSEISKTFATRSAEHIAALSKISLSIGEGELACIVGPSGCGKSTLLRIIAGLVPPSEGSVRLAGRHVEAPTRDVGMVFQTPVLLPWRKVLQNVLVPAEVIGMARADALQRADDLLQLVGLGQFANKYPSELSGGMRQRVAIARALMHDPKTLLMDEPFGALDAMTREIMNIELLRIWRAQRKTILLVTHSIDEAIFLADRIIVMSPRPGRILDVVPVDVPRPRTAHARHDPGFVRLAAQLRDTFEAMHAQGGQQ